MSSQYHRKNSLLDFVKYPAPYLETSLEILRKEYRSKFRYRIRIKNVSNILQYLNHDYILVNNILSCYHYTFNKREFEKYTSINTPIYKNKIKMNPCKNLTLYNYQLNNIELLNKITKNIIKIRDSDTKINLKQTDEEIDLPERKVYFDNYSTKFTFSENYISLKTNGAILADEMGLGKTITMIAFLKSLQSIESDENSLKAKGHLIIVPSHLAKQWVTEIQKVWEDAQIKLILTKRNHLNLTTKEILTYDFVIVTQQFLVNKNHYLQYPDTPCTPSSFNLRNKLSKFKNQDGSIKISELLNIPPVFELITWNNLVLDEAHEIMGESFGSSYTICSVLKDIINSLKGNKKWYISGTPYSNYGALSNIFNFLKVKIQENNKFVNWGESRFKNIVFTNDFIKKIMFRHTKKQVEEQIDLKGLEEHIYWLTQTPTEKQIYQGSKNKGRSYLLRLCCHLMVADYNSAIKIQTVDIEEVKNNIQKQSENKIKTYTEYLTKLNPTSQSYHMLKANYTQIISQAKFMLEAIKNLTNDKDKIEEEQECPICLDTITDPTILPCGHVFCYNCIKEMSNIKKECPMCKQKIKNDLIKVSTKKEANKGKNEEKKDELVIKYGIKTGTLIRLVRKITSNPENNIIIFSQYDFMLKLISDSLSQNGVSNSFVKGNVFQRNKAIESFRGLRMGQSNQVIMLSLKNAASGTHLVEANHIIFVDPVDSYKEDVLDTENQAIARAFRIGQKKKVHIHRLLVKDTIEEEIYNKVYL